MMLDSSQILPAKVQYNSVSVENASINLNMSCFASEHLTQIFFDYLEYILIVFHQLYSLNEVSFIYIYICYKFFITTFIYIQTNVSLCHHVPLRLHSFF